MVLDDDVLTGPQVLLMDPLTQFYRLGGSADRGKPKHLHAQAVQPEPVIGRIADVLQLLESLVGHAGEDAHRALVDPQRRAQRDVARSRPRLEVDGECLGEIAGAPTKVLGPFNGDGGAFLVGDRHGIGMGECPLGLLVPTELVECLPPQQARVGRLMAVGDGVE
ncbi:hypothetical protein [Streptomyces xantholiticus]|uniref:hypothetical protein n=1 Tax=Streptomyces xantholiticus TaxID=68285 RepID=UPI00167AC93A|nr:hypothetical protein [Streptomyces xantholiticus]